MSASDIAHGHFALVVAAAAFADGSQQTLLRSGGRDFLKRADAAETLTWRCGFEFL